MFVVSRALSWMTFPLSSSASQIASAHITTDKSKNKIGENNIMRGSKSIFVSSKHEIKCSLTHEKYFQPTNAEDSSPLIMSLLLERILHTTYVSPVADASLLAAALIAERQLTQRAPGLCSLCVVPAGGFVPILSGNQHHMICTIAVAGLSRGPGRVVWRHHAAAVDANEPAFGDDVSDAQPEPIVGGGSVGALVLRLGAGHGQVGAQLGAEALRLCVVDSLVQPGQTAAGTAGEAGRTAAWVGHSACGYRADISQYGMSQEINTDARILYSEWTQVGLYSHRDSCSGPCSGRWSAEGCRRPDRGSHQRTGGTCRHLLRRWSRYTAQRVDAHSGAHS